MTQPPAVPPPTPQQLNYSAPDLKRESLRRIAAHQRAILMCILAEIIVIVIIIVLARTNSAGLYTKAALSLALISLSITAAVFVFMLAIKIYNVGLGILFGILTMIPYLGLIMLLIINGKATKILRQHGLKVGLMGAKVPKDF